MNRSDEGRQVKLSGKNVEAKNAFGEESSVHAAAADADVDDASAKANRKEAGEPERESAEKAAIEHHDVPAKNTYGHGQREVVGCNVMGEGGEVRSGATRGKVEHKNTF